MDFFADAIPRLDVFLSRSDRSLLTIFQRNRAGSPLVVFDV
jgi:hypothetical protein